MEGLREEFIRFLAEKNIDGEAMARAEQELFTDWMHLFAQVHPKSFVAQKLYQINQVRRKYQLKK
jgi:uncharacterized lipoprotein